MLKLTFLTAQQDKKYNVPDITPFQVTVIPFVRFTIKIFQSGNTNLKALHLLEEYK